MTKERKIAIKMWEEIKQRILTDSLPCVAFNQSKRLIAKAYGVSTPWEKVCSLQWDNTCWFCQYVRRDYGRFGDFWEGNGKGLGEEGCNFCPLAKAHPQYDPSDARHDCGCMLPDAPYCVASNIFHSKEERAAACDTIIKALKGEKIEIEVQEAI